MKNIAYLLVLLALLTNFQKNKIESPDFIEIRHTGAETYHIKTLIISSEKVDRARFKIEEGDYPFFNRNKKTPLTAAKRDAILNMNYNFVMTDDMTYRLFTKYINEHPYYFTNGITKNYGDYKDYSITVKGKVYNVYYLMKDQFF